jgi:hypothetical protein
MTNNTLKTTIEAIIAANALIVVTLDGTFNSQTGASVLSARARPDQRNKFLKDYCEKVSGDAVAQAHNDLHDQIERAVSLAQSTLSSGKYAEAISHIKSAEAAQEQLDQPRVYYRVKPDVDLRSAVERRAAKKAENEAKRAASKAAKEAKAAEKMTAKLAAQPQNTQSAPEVSQPTEAPKGGKSTKRAA